MPISSLISAFPGECDPAPTQSPVLMIPPGPPITAVEQIPRQSFSVSSVVYSCGLVLRRCLSISAAVIRQAITEAPVKIVRAWIKQNLGETVQSKRAKLAHAMRERSTEKPEEP